MNKKVLVIIIVIIVLVILYLVYNKMFANKAKVAAVTVPVNVAVPHVRPIPSGVINSDPLANQNTNTDYGNVQTDLPVILKVLGYDVKPTDANGNIEALGYWNASDILKKFALRFPGTTNINGNLVDNDKWNSYAPLTYVKYNIKDNATAFDYYQKIISFWGKDFFGNLSAQRVTNAASKSVATVDCNSKEYKDKLNRLYANLKGLGNNYQVAVLNLNNVSNAETNQAFDKATKAFNAAEIEYKNYQALCKTN